MIDYLKEQLERTNYWLSFAEAKHAALIAVNIAVLAVCTGMDEWAIWGRSLIIILIVISSGISVISFWPNLAKKLNKNRNISHKNVDNNVFYAENAKQYTPEEFTKQVANKYGLSREENQMQYEEDIAYEILENSQIAMGKYRMFKWAICVDLSYFAIMILLVVLA